MFSSNALPDRPPKGHSVMPLPVRQLVERSPRRETTSQVRIKGVRAFPFANSACGSQTAYTIFFSLMRENLLTTVTRRNSYALRTLVFGTIEQRFRLIRNRYNVRSSSEMTLVWVQGRVVWQNVLCCQIRGISQIQAESDLD